MRIMKRICIKDWEVTAENGDHFSVKRGKEYTTSENRKDGTCTVFSNYWVRVPISHFAGELPAGGGGR